MWYTATVFENFRGSLSDVYDVICRDQPEADDGNENERLKDHASEEEAGEDMLSKSNVSNLQTFWNIFNANQGVVILSMPFVVLSGTYLGLLATAVVAIVSNFTTKKLVRCLYEKDAGTGVEVRVRSSYEEIGEAFAGSFGKWMVYIAMIVEQLSYCTLLLILCGSILHSNFPQSGLEKTHWAMLAFVLVIPNAFMMNLGQVAFVSLLTVVIGQVIYVTVAVYSFNRADNWTIKEAPPLDISKFFVSMGIVVVSYSSQPYMPAIEGSMKNRKKFNQVANITYFTITVVKIAFGLIGYLTFKGDTQQVITNNLPHGPFKITVNIGVLSLALFSFTFPAYTVFVLIDKIRVDHARRWLKTKYEKLMQRASGDGAEDCLLEQTAVSNEREAEEKNEPATVAYKLKRACLRLALITGALAVAIIVPHFGLYMGFVGNFTGMCLSFIFPCLFNMKLRQNDLAKSEFFLHTAIIIFGSVSAGAGMYYSTKELIDAYSSAD